MNKKIFIGITILLILVSCIFLFFSDSFTIKKEGFIKLDKDADISKSNMKEINKHAIIPLDIYQTWHTKDLPPKMRECVEKLKKENPEFTHHLYDDNDCREFIKNNFKNDVLEAFDSLIPGAYKADLWRYCILYKKGGIYLDIKFYQLNDFKFIDLVDKEYFVLDRHYDYTDIKYSKDLDYINLPNYYEKIYDNINNNLWKNKEIGIFTSLIITKPKNIVMIECIKEIVDNVKNNFYGHNALYPTGPGLVGEKYFKGDMSKIKDIELFNSNNGIILKNKNITILNEYSDYRKEKNTYGNNQNYNDLWNKRKIYK